MPEYTRYRSVYTTAKPKMVVRTRTMFFNVCILCGMALAVAVTIKIILSLFS